MKRIILIMMLLCLMTGCGKTNPSENKNSFVTITMEELQEELESEGDYLLLDVRTAEEYAAGHIPGAVCVPVEDIQQGNIEQLGEKDQKIFLYCRSGNRSKTAAQELLKLGFSEIIDCGGIMDWTGEVAFGEE